MRHLLDRATENKLRHLLLLESARA